MTDDDNRRRKRSSKAAKVAARIRRPDGSVTWASFIERTERQAARMKNVRRDIVLDARVVAPRVSTRYPSGAEILARTDYLRRHPPKIVRAPRRLETGAAGPVPPGRATLARRVWDFLTDRGENARPEAQALARSRLAREAAARAAADLAAREAVAALPYVGLDRLLRAADSEALEWDYRRQLEWDASNPERRERWIAEWVRDHPRPSYGPELIDSERAPRSVWDPSRYPRPLTIHYTAPAWARSPETAAAAAYDVALRSGAVRWWWLRKEAEREAQRRAKEEAFRAEMARKHPNADPSRYGILAIQDAKREEAERTAAKYREMDLERARERERERAEQEAATRERYNLPETVPIVPPETPPEPAPEVESTKNGEPVYQTDTPTGYLSGKPENKKTGVSPGVSPPPLLVGDRPRPNEPRETAKADSTEGSFDPVPGGRGEPAIAVSPKASSEAPGAGAGASREAPETRGGASSERVGGSGGSEPAPTPPERRVGRPRLYDFDPSEARRLKSLGFTTAERVRMLNLPDTPSTRRRVREACRE